MTEESASPFVGLDKALIRSTQAQAPTYAGAVSPAPPETSQPSRKSTPKTINGAGTPKRPRTSTDSPSSDPITVIQTSLKGVGKEIYYLRVTTDEKVRLEDLLHTLKRRGIRTSANEIGRIALNQLLTDYETQGIESTVERVLARMHE